MSESEYNRKRAAAQVWESEQSSDEETVSPPPKAKKPKTASTKPSKGKKDKKNESKVASAAVELFGDADPTTQHETPLWSSLTRRVADGTLRHSAVLDGEFFVEVRVSNTEDIRGISDYKERYEKASAKLSVQISPDDPLWQMIKKIFSDGKKKFKADAVFYKNSKK